MSMPITCTKHSMSISLTQQRDEERQHRTEERQIPMLISRILMSVNAKHTLAFCASSIKSICRQYAISEHESTIEYIVDFMNTNTLLHTDSLKSMFSFKTVSTLRSRKNTASGRRGCGGIGRAAHRGADPGHLVRRFKVPLVRPPRAPGSAPPTRAAPEPISLLLARRTPPQRHDRMARAHGACGARALCHGWVLDFNDLIARVRDKVAVAECRRAFLKCEIAILRALLSGRGLGAVVVACAC